MVFSAIAFFSSSVTSLTTFPGEPITKELSGITLFSVIREVTEDEKKAVLENTKHYQDNWKKYSKSVF